MEQQSPQAIGRRLRLIMTLGGFIAALGIGTFVALRSQQPRPHPLSSLQGNQIDPATEPLFYKSIGGNENPENNSAPRGTQFTIEILKTNSKSQAEQKVAELKSQGITGYYTPLRTKDGVFYRVRTGIYATAALAGTAKQELDGKKVAGNVMQLE